MRLATLALPLLGATAFALAACGGEAPAKPEEPAVETPAADAGHGPMDMDMMAADTADDANVAETPDGFMFHTDTSKTESIHLPTGEGVTWTATAEKPDEVEILGAADETMPDGAVHHVIKIQPKKSGVISKVVVEKHEGDTTAATETRTINVMIH